MTDIDLAAVELRAASAWVSIDYCGRPWDDVARSQADVPALVSRIRELEAIVRKISEYSVADKTLIGVAGDLQEIVGGEFPSEWGWGGSETP
ncbi:hypothetical protein [Gordonia tangerina]|uniref:Uncharacterized protein n=1 Tax=Gordonia tangerina TaxID=2911060 RepID=A0ABS9DL08_9ACTN|nr:hypothetical protein [Gordonia tangerina]MCF3939923.1 hypothetical protein [Gordonia tangerina]